MRKTGALIIFCLACNSESASGPDAGPPDAPPELDAPLVEPGEVPASEQRAGDPEAGYHALVNYGYVGCGMPLSFYEQFFGPAAPEEQIPGREGLNADKPYLMSAFTTASGVDVIMGNCLGCHAGRINGELVIGLGAADMDFTNNIGSLAELARSFISDPGELVEYEKWNDRMQAVGPYMVTPVIGVNPASFIAR